jgi:hypothetical protein
MPIAPALGAALGAKIPVPAVVVTQCGEVRWSIIEAATLKAPPLKAVINMEGGVVLVGRECVWNPRFAVRVQRRSLDVVAFSVTKA